MKNKGRKEKPLNKKHVILLFVNTAVLVPLYLVCVRFFTLPTMIVYTVLAAITVFAYVTYNRGFSRKELRIEDLPEKWSDEKKAEYIEDGKRRLEKSKWVITVIIPLMVIFAYEIFDLFILPTVKNLLGIVI